MVSIKRVSPLKKIGIAVAMGVAGVSSIVVASVLHTKQAAESLLNDVRAISVAQHPTQYFDSLKLKYGAKLKRSALCAPGECAYELTTANNVPALLRLVPYTELSATFNVYKGSLSFVHIQCRVAPRGDRGPVVHTQIDFCDAPCHRSFYIHPHGRAATERMNGIAEFNAYATSAERDAALALNLDCFVKLGGCKNIAELMPRMWQIDHSGRVTAAMRSMADASSDWP